MASTHAAKRTAREAEDSKPVEGMARFGLTGRGLVYAVLGVLALQVAFGHGARADKQGALAAIRDQPLGGVLLVLLAVSFAGYAVWRLLQGAVGHRNEEDAKRTFKRLGSLGRACIYGFLAVSTARFLITRPSGDKTEPLTARVMAVSGGRVAVGLLGAAVVVGGLYMAYRGATEKFLKRLDLAGASSPVRRGASAIGVVGLVGRGLVLALVGAFLVQASVTFDPHKAKGLDAALKSLADEPAGTFLIGGAAAGLLFFGAWSFVEARYRRV
jgi:hypothetical protein